MISLILSASRLMISSVNIDISTTLPSPRPPPSTNKYQVRPVSATKWSECGLGGVKLAKWIIFTLRPSVITIISSNCIKSDQADYDDTPHIWLYDLQSVQSGRSLIYFCSPLTGFDSLKNLTSCQDHFNLSLDKGINWSNIVRGRLEWSRL